MRYWLWWFVLPLAAASLALAQQPGLDGEGSALYLPGAIGPGGGTRWALLVGIDQYEDPDISKLDFAVADVKAVAADLVSRLGYPPDNVKVMTSDVAGGLDRPTNVNVAKRLEYLAQKIGPNDTFLFYFSGHGYQRGEDRHFLGTVNADPTNIETLELSSLPLRLLQEKMKKIQARTVVFFIDACRNNPERGGKGDAANALQGSFARDLQVVAASARSGLAGSAVFFACSEGQRAWEWREQQHGVFSYYLLKGIEGAAAEKGELTVSSLGDYVQRQVMRWAEERGKQQKPDVETKGAARIVLGRLGAGPGPASVATGGTPATTTTGMAPITTGPSVPSAQPGKTWVNPKDGMEFVYVPAGLFKMGSVDGEKDEMPVHTVELAGYWIGKYEVTVGQFRKFLEEGGYVPQGDWKKSGDDPRLPVVYVTWNDAVAYCKWAGVRLPTEAEWEKAARATDGRTYPWGNEWDPRKVNSTEGNLGHAAPVGTYPDGASPYGALDMGGNVWEWTSSLCQPYPYNADDGREDPKANGLRVVRGGGWFTDRVDARAGFRLGFLRDGRVGSLGFRCARPSE